MTVCCPAVVRFGGVFVCAVATCGGQVKSEFTPQVINWLSKTFNIPNNMVRGWFRDG